MSYERSIFPAQQAPLPPQLFTESTISKDDTRGVASREARLLGPGRPIPSPGGPLQSQRAGPIPLGPSLIPPRQRPGMPGQMPAPKPPNQYVDERLTHIREANLSEGNTIPSLGEGESSWRQELKSMCDVPPSADTNVEVLNNTEPPFSSKLEVSRNPLPDGEESRRKRPQLAAALGSLAREHLQLDVLDESNDTSRYISFLLDLVHKQQSRISYLASGKNSISYETLAKKEIAPHDDGKPHYLILHRVFCDVDFHKHNATVFADLPTVNTETSGLLQGEELLSGNNLIPDISEHVRKFPNCQFIVINEHICVTFNSIIRTPSSSRTKTWQGDFDKQTSKISARKERIRIISPLLQKMIADMAVFKPDTIEFDDPVEDSPEMDAPYRFIFHHHRQLRETCANQGPLGSGLTLLLDYVMENYETDYLEAEEMFGRGFVSEKHIEKLFTPNQIVVDSQTKDLVFGVMLDEWPVRDMAVLRLSGWTWRYDGRELLRRRWFGALEVNFPDEVAIDFLSIHPVQHAKSEVAEMLRARGEKYWSMKMQKLVSYTGWDQHHSFHYSNERFMVDTAMFSKMHPSYSVSPKPSQEDERFQNMPESIPAESSLTEDQLLILPAIIPGYSLREKKWVTLKIEQTGEVLWNKKAFERLVLDRETKDLLRALIDVRMSSTKKFSDLVEGKGNGLVMLLHGSPGTGKSLTAESIAEFAEKPLYRVTCGDIGTEPQRVERYLETIFHLGKAWDCVLLLDEADVFLEERSVSDLQRNSLVSVFLRALEFYDGIIFLTSNRVGTFDEAFQSRIRIALRYEPLALQSRRAIWKNFFEMLDEDDEEIRVNIRGMDQRLDELAAYKINGRQIRNVLLTARQLAVHRQERLEWDHLKQVLNLSDSFNKYLREVKGHSDEDWAKSQALR
ncbi:hypothetical protein BX600DRAFT_469621 [Xylariales sp. PMI_506]|nr:hypothetical protein BX600DRAFT_469621 [Xylariales sp. PMI_506]